jgi:hypothetical protein
MCYTSLAPSGSSWLLLPAEIRTMILSHLSYPNAKGTGTFAAVCKEWRSFFEKRNFSHLRLHQTCLRFLGQLYEEQMAQIDHIWLNIELKSYTCRACRNWESVTWTFSNGRIIEDAVLKLFGILAKWEHEGRHLTLELNTYSPSDSAHWFKNCYFGAPDEDKYEVLAKPKVFHHRGL